MDYYYYRYDVNIEIIAMIHVFMIDRQKMGTTYNIYV